MQATLYKPDAAEGRRRNLEPSTLEADNDFADVVFGEKQPLFGQNDGQVEQVWNNLLRYTRTKTWLTFIWSIEVLVILFVIMAVSMEAWGACPYEMGFAPACKYCYSSQFLVWSGILVGLWFVNLYLFMLLVSRGFTLTMRKLGNVFVENEARGIPTSAITTFLYLTAIIFAWLLVGVFLLVISASSCNSKGAIFTMSSPGRSGLMVSSTVLCVVSAPILLFQGRRCGPGPNQWLPDVKAFPIPVPTQIFTLDL